MRNRRTGRRALVLVAAAIAIATVGADFVPAGAADDGVSGYIVGGQAVAEGQYPSLAAIMIDEPATPARQRLICTGTVVNPRWVMTAGHCADAVLFEPIVAQVGRRDLGSPKAQVLKINRAVVHKTYFDRGIAYDVALFHTMTTINAPVARLSTTAADDALAAGGRSATAVGWGFTKPLAILEPPAPRAKPPRRANAVDIPIVADPACASTYADFFPGYFVPASDLCAGTQGKSVCYGDSGGPLYAKDPKGGLVQIGITSRGAGCATKLFPAIFTEVHRVHGWIAKWTTTKCEHQAFPQDPDHPSPLTGPLYVC